MPPSILVTDQIHDSAVRILRPVAEVTYIPSLSADELLSKIADFDALMVRSASRVTAEVLARGERLQIIGRAGVGTDNIDLPTATQRGVVVVNSPEGNTIAAAEHTVGMLFALFRHIPRADASMKAGRWERSKLVGAELFGKTLGVVGLGKIGSRVAKAARALGMKVLVYDPFLASATADELGVTSVPLETIWAESDVLTFHAPKTKETTHLLNRTTLALCKPGVRVVNCARGGLIDDVALAEALVSGHVAGAAVDVFETEPPPADHPLLTLPEAVQSRVVLTPHLGASTEEAQVNVAIDVAEQIRDFFVHGTARSAVNLPLLRQDLLDPVRPYMPLAEMLGSMARQLTGGAAESVEILAQGSLSGVKTAPLTLAVLKGLLSVSREGVNYVNAPLLAEEAGIQVQESTSKKSEDYLNRLSVQLKTAQRTVRVAGTLLADGIFRIVEVDGYRTTLEPTPNLLFAPHKDQPGMVAQVASRLGEAGVNISALQVGRRGQAAGGESMMLFNLDSAPPDETLAALRQVPGIHGVVAIRLPGA